MLLKDIYASYIYDSFQAWSIDREWCFMFPTLLGDTHRVGFLLSFV